MKSYEEGSFELASSGFVSKFKNAFSEEGAYLKLIQMVVGDEEMKKIKANLKAIEGDLQHILDPSVVVESRKEIISTIRSSLMAISSSIQKQYKQNKEELRSKNIDLNVSPFNGLIFDCNLLISALTISQQKAAASPPPVKAPPARSRSDAIVSRSGGPGLFTEKHEPPKKAQTVPASTKKTEEIKPHPLKRGGWDKK